MGFRQLSEPLPAGLPAAKGNLRPEPQHITVGVALGKRIHLLQNRLHFLSRLLPRLAVQAAVGVTVSAIKARQEG